MTTPAGRTRAFGTLLPVMLSSLLPLLFGSPSSAGAQESPLPLFRELGLRPTSIGSTTLWSTPGHESWAAEIVELSAAAASMFNDSLGLSFDLSVAVLAPSEWRTWFVEGDDVTWAAEQYGMPWAWPPDRLIAVPATLDEGLVIRDPSDIEGNRRRLRFIALHELGHVSAREFFHPKSESRWSPVGWFEEFLATYFAVAFASLDEEMTAFVVRFSTENVEGADPVHTDLDAMHQVFAQLPPAQAAANYGWFQSVINLKAVELFERHGFRLLTDLREALDWDSFDRWSTDYLLDRMDRIDPGFRSWAEAVPTASFTDTVREKGRDS
jgi:hypothetical protein